VEEEAIPAARALGWVELPLRVVLSGEGEPVAVESPDGDIRLDGCPRVGRLLLDRGIRRMALDARLEQNQVADILLVIHACRKQSPSDDRRPCRLARHLLSPSGLMHVCTNARIEGKTLHVQYTYCLTRFSRVVKWFEGRQRRFRDHRAIFLAAPRYAVIAAVIAAIPFLIYWALPYRWVLVGATLMEVGVLFALVYLSLMTVGSVEYDNEEKAHRLAKANEELRRYARNISSDLRRAAGIQESMLPSTAKMPFPDDIEWASSFVPEEEVGGDYFDVQALDDHRVAVVFVDVSGHGMAAAFITAIIKTAFISWVRDGYTMLDFLQHLNVLLCRFTPEGSFAAVIAAEYDILTQTLTYVNAGHNPRPWYIPREGDRTPRSLTGGKAMVLGVVEDLELEADRLELASDDMILLATDGLIEAVNDDGEMFTTERAEEVLGSYPVETADHLVKRVNENVGRFVQDAAQTDDRTILAFRIR
jgi:serine phosphatase RsbU (regulator of sigma subunit)